VPQARPNRRTLEGATLLRWLSKPTPFRDGRILVLPLLAGLVFLLIPRPFGWSLDHLNKEDGQIFLHDWLTLGTQSLFTPYSGYLHVLPRTLSMLGAALPIEWFAAWIGVATAVIKVGICALAFPVFRAWLGSNGWAVAAAMTPAISPLASQEVLGNLTNLRWYMAFVVFLIAWSNHEGWGINVILAVTGILATLSEPLTVLVVPLLILRSVINSGWARVPSVASLTAIAAHFTWFVQVGDRGEVIGAAGLLTHPVETLEQLMLRGPAAALFGSNAAKIAMKSIGPAYWLVGLAVVAVGIALSMRWARQRPSQALFCGVLLVWGLVVLAATMAYSSWDRLALTWYAVGDAARYSASAALYLIPAALGVIGPTITKPSWPPRVAAWALVAGMALGVVADFAGDKWNYTGPTWASSVREARAACSQGQSSVTVQFTPEGTPMAWDAVLPCRAFR
jgi:hypothetical protein